MPVKYYTSEEIENQINILDVYLSKHSFVTGKKACALINTTRRYACYLLCTCDKFKKFYRNPANVEGRKRISWKSKE